MEEMEAKGTAGDPPRRRLRPVPAVMSAALSIAPSGASSRGGEGGAGDVRRLACALEAVARVVGDCPEEAVAAVVMNRLAVRGREALAEVLEGLLAGLGAGPVPDVAGRGDLAFATRLRLARRALAGVLDDPTRGATRCRPAGLPDGRRAGALRIGGLVFDPGEWGRGE